MWTESWTEWIEQKFARHRSDKQPLCCRNKNVRSAISYCEGRFVCVSSKKHGLRFWTIKKPKLDDPTTVFWIDERSVGNEFQLLLSMHVLAKMTEIEGIVLWTILHQCVCNRTFWFTGRNIDDEPTWRDVRQFTMHAECNAELQVLGHFPKNHRAHALLLLYLKCYVFFYVTYYAKIRFSVGWLNFRDREKCDETNDENKRLTQTQCCVMTTE